MKQRLARSVEQQFDEYHIGLVWTVLEEKFSFNVKMWKVRFTEYLMKQPRGVHVAEAFVKFGNDFINPILNEILCRGFLHPTFNNMIVYVVTKGKK